MSQRVLNRRTTYDRSPNCVYVGRPSKWGNPFEIGRDGTRDEVVDKYEGWLRFSRQASDLRCSLHELRGKDLVCWCAPERCHAEVLLKLVNELPSEEEKL